MTPILPATLTSHLAWLAGVEPATLNHAYPDRSRFVSLGLSVVAAAGMTGAGSAMACGLALGSWFGWLLFPLASIGFGFVMRWLLAWSWQGQHFGRRLGLIATGLLCSALLIAWPLQHYLLQGPNIRTTTGTLRSLDWAVYSVVALVLLIPIYATAAAGGGTYARVVAARRAYENIFSA